MSRDSHVPAGYGLALSRKRREKLRALWLSQAIVSFASFSDHSAVEGRWKMDATIHAMTTKLDDAVGDFVIYHRVNIFLYII